MAGVESASLNTPGEIRTFALGKVELVNVGGSTVGRFTFEPGWRWSESVKPIVKTESCQSHHVGYALSGRMRVRGADGVESDIGAADAYDIAPGHDAWIVGDEVFVGLEFKSAAEYAKPN